MLLRIASFLLVIFAGQAFSQVREINFMEEIIQEIDGDTLVIFDIDNTVIEPTGQVGSDQWYYYLAQKFQSLENLSLGDAHYKAERLWNTAQSYIKTQAVEEQTPQIIARLQERNIPVMALTARSREIAEITRQQLSESNINFQKSSPKYNYAHNSTRYEGGILYQGEGFDKGKTLVEFLRHTNLKPKKIVFIDDKEKNTNNVNRALQELDIIHVEFRYGRTDEKVREFQAKFLKLERSIS